MTALAIDDQLLQSVRSSYGYIVLAADLVGQFFNVLVGSFRFFCIHNINIMVFLHFSLTAFYFICIKNKNQCTACKSLIVT